MSILSSTNSGKRYFEKKVEDWLTENLRLQPNDYELLLIKDNGGKELVFEIDVFCRDVNLMDFPEKQLPDFIQFKQVGGNFLCAYSHLTSTKGFPRVVDLSFDCSSSALTSLEGMPKIINRDFICRGMPFTEEDIRANIHVSGKVFK
ncbi:MAG: hypothetical protein U0L47_04425 [Paludibacteraceae bacterium]|nr:hypothetical protein [Paludibacteraceae bacterium]